MANTFFGFNTVLNNDGDRLGSSPEDIEGLETEEEYDALNDETFGTLENEGDLDDWEAQHEQFAEIAESSKHDIESYLDHLVLNDEETTQSPKDKNVWSYNSNEVKNGEKLTSNYKSPSALELSVKLLPTISHNDSSKPPITGANLFNQQLQHSSNTNSMSANQVQAPAGPKMQSVEELERMLLNQSKLQPNRSQTGQQPLGQGHGFGHNFKEMSPHQTPRFPPGFQHLSMAPPSSGGPGPYWPSPHMPAGHHSHGPPHQIPPPMIRMMGQHGRPPPPGHMMQPPPGFVYGHGQPGAGFAMNSHFNFPPPPRLNMPMGHPQQRGNYTPHPNNNNNFPGPKLAPGQNNITNSNQATGHHNNAIGYHSNALGHHINTPGHHSNISGHHNNAPGHHNNASGHHNNHFQSFQHHQHGRHDQSYQLNNNNHRSYGHTGGGDLKDEYAGLMNSREKQWLLNIQLMQVSTEVPYFEDYYYTVYKERQTKNKDHLQETRNQNQRYHNNRFTRDGNVGHHRNSIQENRQDNQQNPINKKVYTPLQFENSLGKLQFGSVTAPRKIIDMDIITLEKDSENTQNSRDSRKTKQLLLEIEALYTLVLKAEDLKNPVAISNNEKLIELKQKQRIRDIDAAQTPEQKQEILKLLQAESVAPVETLPELLTKIVNVLLQDDKLQSFLGIRKGKMLLLRILPQLSCDLFLSQLLELWTKFLLSVPLIGRRDTIGDNILPRFYPLIKSFVTAIDMDQILEIVTSLIEIIKLEHNSRSTPLSHQSKPPLHFILQNKFGISAVSLLLQRVDLLLDTNSSKQLFDWSNFLNCLADTLLLVSSNTATPIEPITEQVLNKQLEKLDGFTQDKRQILERIFIDSN